MSKKNYFLLAKKYNKFNNILCRATYLDYELLINVFNGKNINLTQSTVLLIDNDSMSSRDYKKTLSQINLTKQTELAKLVDNPKINIY